MLDNACKTTGGAKPNVSCVFPFTYGETYNACIRDENSDEAWCSTKVSKNGNHIGGNWGHCGSGCPGEAGMHSLLY